MAVGRRRVYYHHASEVTRKMSLCQVLQLLKGTNLKFRDRSGITPGMDDAATIAKVNIYIVYLEINVPRTWGGWIGWHQKITKLATPW